jgi:hypothetical protein
MSLMEHGASALSPSLPHRGCGSILKANVCPPQGDAKGTGALSIITANGR